MNLMRFIIVCSLMTIPTLGLTRSFYSVSVDVPTKVVSESAWRADNTGGTWAPQTVSQIADHGVMVSFTPQNLVDGAAWEMDLSVLQVDGNILHLLGTATTSAATVSADLVGAQNSDCHATLQAQVDVTSQQLLIEKLHFTCLGKEVQVATAALPRE